MNKHLNRYPTEALMLPPDYLNALYAMFRESSGVCTDTRRLETNQMFFALKGPNFDANLYAGKALSAGANAAVVDDSAVFESLRSHKVFYVTNALHALQQTAAHHRRQMGVEGRLRTVIGITGSNGKTTTKELATNILTKKYCTHATPGNLNNQIGLPLTLLMLNPQHQVAIVEMGDNQPHDIQELANIADPDIALITNLGLDHLGGYESRQANILTKLELFDFVKAKPNARIVLNGNDPHLQAYVTKHKISHYTYTQADKPADLRGRLVANRLEGIQIQLCLKDATTLEISTKLPGSYNLDNVLAASALGLILDVPLGLIKEAIIGYVPSNLRSQLIRLPNGRKVILDAYNANPSSVFPAIESLMEVRGNQPVGIVLADMLELGHESESLHRELGIYLANALSENDGLLLIGKEMKYTRQAFHEFNGKAKALALDSLHKAVNPASAFLEPYTLILLKGSRSFQLEQMLSTLANNHKL